MVPRVDLVVHACDSSLLIDQKAHALGPSGFRIIGGSISERDRLIGIAEQRKRECVLLRECGIRIDAVEARAQDLDLVFIVVVLMVAEPATFDRSSRCIGRGIKPQQHLASAQICERYRSAVMRRQRKIGRHISDLDHRCLSFGLTAI